MKNQTRVLALAALLAMPLTASAQETNLNLTFSTLITTPLAIEGLTSDYNGNLYTAGRSTTNGEACPVWRIPLTSPSLNVVGLIPAPSATATCSPSGLQFGPDGQLYVTQTDRIYRFRPATSGTPPTAEVFATGVPGTNGLAFDRSGNLWTGDGTTGVGRVWKIATNGTVTEMFRIPPMSNEVNLAAGVGGVGRDVRSLPPGTITVTPTSRNATNTLGSQPLVANGLQITRRGNILIVDTARGAVWGVYLRDGGVESRVGCDSTYPPLTLCLDSVFVAHPALEGADGFVLDENGNMWIAANERNAMVFVSAWGDVIEAYRNPPDATTKLRNKGPLETPTSPVLVDHKLCTANSDGNRRDNSPNTEGEIGGTGQPRGKISCLDQEVRTPGMVLPLR